MENEDYAVPIAYVFCQENVQIKGKVATAYFIMLYGLSVSKK